MIKEKNLPNGWAIKPMTEVVTWGAGGTPKATESQYYDNGDIPWLIIGDLNDGVVTESQSKITELGLKNSSAKIIPAGTLLVAMYGSIGKLGITGIECCTNQAIAFAKELRGVSTKYMFYYMAMMKSKLISMGKGGTQNNISQTILKSLNVIVPPPEVQDNLVFRIEELFSELDKAVETLQTTKQQLAVYRQAVLKEAFEIAIQGYNAKSDMLSIEELLTTDRKGMATGPFGTMIKKHEHQKSGIPMLGIENIGEGKYVDGNKIFVTTEKAEELKSFALHAGDIIISRSGTVGEICAVPQRAEGALLSTNLMRVSLNHDVIRSDYFIFLFQSKGIVLDQVKELCKGSTRIFLNQTILKQIQFPVPSLNKQMEIVHKIESRLSVCESIEQTVDTALAQADAMRQSILKQAFEGGFNQ